MTQQNNTLPLTPSHHLFDYLAITTLYLTIISLPFSTGYIHTLLPAVVILSLLGGYWKQKWKLIIREPFIKWTLILVALFAVRVFYSQSGLFTGAKGLMKYTKLLYAIPLLPLFFNQPKRISYTIAILQLTIFVAVIMSIGHQLEIWQLIKSPESKHISDLYYTNTYINPIPFGVFVAFSALFSIHFIKMHYKKLDWIFFVNIINLIPLSYYILVVSIQRSTFLLFIAAIVSYLWFSINHIKYKLMAFVILLILGSVLVFIIPNSIIDRINEGCHEINTYISEVQESKIDGDTTINTDTSFGLRAEFIRKSFKIIKENQLFGTGTGSFAQTFTEAGGPLNNKETGEAWWDPHNEFLLIGIQIGIIGLLAFIIWIFSIYRSGFKMSREYAMLVNCSLIILILHSISNTSIYYSVNGIWYVIIFSALIASKIRNENRNPI